MIVRRHRLFAAAALAPLVMLAGCHKAPITAPTPTPTPGPTPSLTTGAATSADPAAKDWTTVVAKTQDQGYRMGNPDARVKLVEYGSRTCPHCAEFAKTALPKLEAYVRSGSVSYEYRDFLRDGADIGAALIGRCKGAEGFFPLLAAQYAEQGPILDRIASTTKAQLDTVASAPQAEQPYLLAKQIGYLSFAKEHGIDEAQARTCLSDLSTVDAIGRMNERAVKTYDLPGTPTFLVNGKKTAAIGWPDLEQVLVKAGATR